MKEIKLANGKGIALVDDADFEKVNQYKWKVSTRYARHSYREGKKIKGIQMHRFLLKAPINMQVDHINGNGLDNRRSNLRLATRSQNQWNTKRVNSKTGFKGVSYHNDTRRKKPWMAHITIYDKTRTVGHFYTAEEAARAYDKRAKELFGEFASTNFKQ